MQKTSLNSVKEFPRRNVCADQAIKILKKNGLVVTYEQANEILEFLYLIAKTTCHPEKCVVSRLATNEISDN